MYVISKKFTFSAAHRLNHLALDHPCSRDHGHNYEVEVVLRSATLDAYGFVIDYNDLSDFNHFLQSELDHRHLNEVLPFQPTAENIAKFLYEEASKYWKQVYAVRVSETSKTWAEYSKGLSL